MSASVHFRCLHEQQFYVVAARNSTTFFAQSMPCAYVHKDSEELPVGAASALECFQSAKMHFPTAQQPSHNGIVAHSGYSMTCCYACLHRMLACWAAEGRELYHGALRVWYYSDCTSRKLLCAPVISAALIPDTPAKDFRTFWRLSQ